MVEHEVCPTCGSDEIDEVKPKWMVCKECGDNFHKEAL
jgi:ribosomal protein L37AE/L43A